MVAGSGGTGQFQRYFIFVCFLVVPGSLTRIPRGCVSGHTITNLQEKIGKDAKGEYQWDFLDGWEELE